MLGTACATAQSASAVVTPTAGSDYLGREALRQDPADSLRMPGADEFQVVAAQGRAAPGGYVPAFDGAIFGTAAAPDEVHAFYADRLASLGWQPDTYGVFPTSTDQKVWGWCKPDRLFRLAILDPRSLAPMPNESSEDVTLFHATINARTRGVSCPSH
jgi:hypothetical protein